MTLTKLADQGTQVAEADEPDGLRQFEQPTCRTIAGRSRQRGEAVR